MRITHYTPGPLTMKWTQRDAASKNERPEPAASSSCLTRMEKCADPSIPPPLSSHYSARSFGSPGRSYSPPSIPSPSSRAETRRCCEARLAQTGLLGKRPKWNGSLCFLFYPNEAWHDGRRTCSPSGSLSAISVRVLSVICAVDILDLTP